MPVANTASIHSSGQPVDGAISRLTLRLIGEAVIEVGSTTVEPTATHLFSLLLYLGVERGRTVPRNELCALLFPESSAEDASHSLRQLIYRAKRKGAPVQCSSAAVSLPRESVVDDLSCLVAAPHLDRDLISPSQVEVLPHYVPPTEALRSWLEGFKERVRPQLIRALTRELGTARAESDWRSVDAIATTLIELDPFNETATLGRAEALARIGSKREAVALLRHFEEEVGKSEETLALPPRVLARRISESYSPEVSPIDTPMLGRERELRRLMSFWSRARQGHFTTVVICGSESIGKTRLVTECASSIQIDGTGAVIVTKRAPLDSERPLSLFADTAKQLRALRGAAGCSPHTHALITRLTRTRESEQVASGEQRNAEYSHLTVRRAVTDLFDSVASERPLCIVIDDAEYLDEPSLTLLRHLRMTLASRPCLLVLASRVATTGESLGAARIRLGPLGESDSAILAKTIDACLGSTLSLHAQDRIVGLAAGNPGHMRLLLADVAHSRREDSIPSDFVAAVDARLSSLSAKALHILQACALFGSPCSTNDVSRLTGLTGYQLLGSIQELEDSFLIDVRAEGFQCATGLIEERVRASTTPGVAALLHLRAARHLERSISRSVTSQALSWTIAEHWRKAGELQAALSWSQRCWQHLISIGQPMAAVKGIRSALADVTTVEERAAMLSSLAMALRAIGDFSALTKVLEERISLSNAVNDTVGQRNALALDLFEANNAHSVDLSPMVKPLRGHVHNTKLDTTHRLRAARLLIIAADHCFDSDAATEAYAQLRTLRTSDPFARLSHLSSCLIYHTVFGERADALACIEQITEVSSLVELSWERIAAAKCCHIARRVVAPGPFAGDDLAKAFEDCRDVGVRRSALSIAGLLSLTHFDDGCVQESLRWGSIAEELASQLPSDLCGADFLEAQIDLALFNARMERAHSLLRQLCAIGQRGPGGRIRRELLVYKVRVNQFSDRVTDDEDLAELLHFHECGKRLGRHDDNAEVLYVALRNKGEKQRASSLLREYLTEARREVRRCNHWLRVRTADDEVWSDPAVKHLA